MTVSAAERAILETLDRLFERPAIGEAIAGIAHDAVRRLHDQPSGEITWAPVPLATYGVSLPPVLRSSWVFVLRRGVTTESHRHPNSHQRMMSFRGSGNLQTKPDSDWLPHVLTSARGAPLLSRWISIPAHVWHRGQVGGEDWVVVSFHTAAEDELIEEQQDAADPEKSVQRTYV